ncbi:hypothetical protein [Candidatus Uabimicrobium sp. HlEnr_7]|uniref:hypothetical protein n=1 Tax=Candidatus Uabimicrobium helgolandensis TaxID=3095367 RepID=UPI0035573725
MDSSEGYDTYKVYIGMMAILCMLAMGWLVYNYYSYSSYSSSFELGIRDYKKIVALEKEIPPSAANEDEDEDEETIPVIQKTFTFFKRTVPGISPQQVEGPEQEKGNENDIDFIDRTYTIGFKSISREKLARYIFYIKERAQSLKVNLVVKNLEMFKVENSKPYDDLWKVDMQFVHRLPNTEEEDG